MIHWPQYIRPFSISRDYWQLLELDIRSSHVQSNISPDTWMYIPGLIFFLLQRMAYMEIFSEIRRHQFFLTSVLALQSFYEFSIYCLVPTLLVKRKAFFVREIMSDLANIFLLWFDLYLCDCPTRKLLSSAMTKLELFLPPVRHSDGQQKQLSK